MIQCLGSWASLLSDSSESEKVSVLKPYGT